MEREDIFGEDGVRLRKAHVFYMGEADDDLSVDKIRQKWAPERGGNLT